MPKKLTIEEFIERSKKIHENKFDYSKVEYINKDTKVKIICPIHGEFMQRAGDHIRGIGCSKCRNTETAKRQVMTKEDFIKRAKEVHGDIYNYSLIDIYKGDKYKIEIICPKHGKFSQRAGKHIYAVRGCPVCKESKGEKEIAKILTEMNVEFIREYKFENCKNINPLPFDFYVPSTNTVIEFQGRQHYEVIERWGGEKSLIKQQTNDKIKKEYCKTNNIKFLEIKYDEDIKELLKSM